MTKQHPCKTRQPVTSSFAAQPKSGALDRRHSFGPNVCVQREASGPAVHPAAPALVRSVVESPGQPVDPDTRSLMEPHLGYDFSGVRVHTDQGAAESARAVSAHAYTAGSHVVFGDGQYAPGTTHGRRLIAHELTHVVQQSSGPVGGESVQGGMSVSDPSDSHEQKARAAGDRTFGDHNTNVAEAHERSPVPVARPATGHIQVQRVDSADVSAQRSADYGEASAITGGIVGGLGLLGSLAGLIIAGKTLAATRRQADAAEDPPIQQPTSGGVSSTHVDKIDEIKGPAAKVDQTESVDVADVTTKEDKASGLTKTQTTTTQPDGPTIVETETKKGKNVLNKTKSTIKDAEPAGGDTEKTFTVLRLQEGKDNRAEFKLNLRSNQRDIKGGNTEDGDIIGYTGGSAQSNAGVAFKAGPGASVDNMATVRLSFAGTNTPARITLRGDDNAPTKRANSPQRFSGSLRIDAKMNVIDDSVRLSVNPPGTSNKKAGDGKSAPIVVVSLNAPEATPIAESQNLNPSPTKGTPPPPAKP